MLFIRGSWLGDVFPPRLRECCSVWRKNRAKQSLRQKPRENLRSTLPQSLRDSSLREGAKIFVKSQFTVFLIEDKSLFIIDRVKAKS